MSIVANQVGFDFGWVLVWILVGTDLSLWGYLQSVPSAREQVYYLYYYRYDPFPTDSATWSSGL